MSENRKRGQSQRIKHIWILETVNLRNRRAPTEPPDRANWEKHPIVFPFKQFLSRHSSYNTDRTGGDSGASGLLMHRDN